MSTVWFTSDTHFRHAKVASLREFESVFHHDEWITNWWNTHVRPEDTVWHLGDVAMHADGLSYVRKLNGVIHLVTGNHDAAWPGHKGSRKCQRAWMELFASVQAFAKVKVSGTEVLLSHFPYNGDHSPHDRHVQYRLRDEGTWLLHGHVHSAVKKTGDHSVHVGLDAWGLRPANVDEVAELMR